MTLHEEFCEISQKIYDQTIKAMPGADPLDQQKVYDEKMNDLGYTRTEHKLGGDYFNVVSKDGIPIQGGFKAWNIKGETELQKLIKEEFGQEYEADIYHVANSDVDFEFIKK